MILFEIEYERNDEIPRIFKEVVSKETLRRIKSIPWIKVISKRRVKTGKPTCILR